VAAPLALPLAEHCQCLSYLQQFVARPLALLLAEHCQCLNHLPMAHHHPNHLPRPIRHPMPLDYQQHFFPLPVVWLLIHLPLWLLP
jgi:hypothetical protein